ncbi:MAG TPA: APC family permease [Streptosporangiaceae bacterium]|nr:APC family permease [Streptosporangiaceae bacterium]
MFTRRRLQPRVPLVRHTAAGHGLPRPVREPAHPPARRFIRWQALALLTVGSVGYLGSAPALSVYGLAAVFLYVLPAFLFLLPISLVAAELASGWPGGVYNWVREGISAPMGLLAVWCEFAQTIFYYPALLAYVASTLAYVFDQRLASNGVYNAIVIIVLFWGGVAVSSRGVSFVAKLSSGGTVLGTLIPAALLIALGAAYLVQGNHSAAPMTSSHLLPAWSGPASIVLVVNSFFTYAGVEVNAVHVDELRNPAREYPRSIFVATALVLAIFIGPTLAISWVIPAQQISFTAGVMQAFSSLLGHFGVAFGVPVLAVALVVGALAGMMAWLDGPSEGLLRIGRQQGFLPPYFQKVNGQGIEIRILAAQGTVITLIAVLYAFIPSVSRAYWIFAVMATQIYLIMYVLMFIAAIRLRRSQPDRARGYRVPALGVLTVLGVVSSAAALVIGFVPPAQFGHENPLVYAVLILAGILVVGILPPLLMDRFRKPGWKAASGSGKGQERLF